MAWREQAEFYRATVRGGLRLPPVAIADAATYTVKEYDSGKAHLVPDVTSSITITFPAAEDGLNFKFIYKGAAADAQNHVFKAAGTSLVKGAVVHFDSDAGAAGDEVVPVFGNGSSHNQLTAVTPDGYELSFFSDGTDWFLAGYVSSATVPAFAAA